MAKSYLVKGPYPDVHISTLEAERPKDELDDAAGHPDYPPIRTWIATQLAPDDRECRGQGSWGTSPRS